MFDLGSVVAHIKADLSQFNQGIEEAKAEASSFGDHLKNTGESIKGFAEQASVFVGVQALAFGELAKQAIEVASSFEQTQTSFGTLLGSEQKAADLMKEIMTFEQHTPFDIGTLTDAAKGLLAYGVSQKEIVPHLKEFTDMSQGQASKLKELVSIYGEVNSIQQLNGREVLRLSSIGIPIYDALEKHFSKMGGAALDSTGKITDMGTATVNNAKMSAAARQNLTDRIKEENAQLTIDEEKTTKTKLQKDQLAKTIMTLKDHIAEGTAKLGQHTVAMGGMGGAAKLTGEEIKKMISTGQVNAKVFDEVLSEMTSKGGLFFNENIRQMSTLNGIMSSTRSQLEYAILNIMGIDIGAANEVRKGGLFDTLRNLAAKLLDGIQKLQPILKAVGENKNFQIVIEGIVIAIASLVVILPILVIAMNPVILIVLAIEAAIVALWWAWNSNFLNIRGVTKDVISWIVDFFNSYLKPAIESVAKWWKDHWELIQNVLMGVWYVIKGVVEVVFAIIVGIIEVGLALISGKWTNVWKALVTMVQTGLDGIVNILEGGIILVANAAFEIGKALIRPFTDAWNTISGVVNKIKDALDFTKRHSPSVVDIVENGVNLVNKHLGNIATPNLNYNAAFGSAFNSTGINGAASGNQIHIDMSNALISDDQTAMKIGEKVGDAIVRKLGQSIRY